MCPCPPHPSSRLRNSPNAASRAGRSEAGSGEHARRLRDLLPGSQQIVEVPGGKLFFPYERPEALAEPLLKFWDGLG